MATRFDEEVSLGRGKIVQLVPLSEPFVGIWAEVDATEEENVQAVACLALIEDESGNRRIAPIFGGVMFEPIEPSFLVSLREFARDKDKLLSAAREDGEKELAAARAKLP